MERAPVVALEDVSFSFDGYQALHSVNLDIRQNDLVSIVGPNGGGKTTLLKLILGLLRPSKGVVRVFGLAPAESRRRIGYMPQHAHLDPQFPIAVRDVVMMGRIGHGRPLGPYSKADKAACEESLRELRMWDLRSSHFSALSGGQRQRVLIARALASKPDLLLLDEPTAGLDLAVETELYDLLKSFAQRLTVIIVSHDLGFVSRFVDRVVCVKRRVVVHPATEITGEMINDIYGAPMKIVRHDHANSEAFHRCITS
jgi:zinc transport system ATP-binding protein